MIFRFPHPAENIGDAVRDALDPGTPADGSLATQLMNENNRAIEDYLGSQSGSYPTPPDPSRYQEKRSGIDMEPSTGATETFYLPWASGRSLVVARLWLVLDSAAGAGVANWYLHYELTSDTQSSRGGGATPPALQLIAGLEFTATTDETSVSLQFGFGATEVTSAVAAVSIDATWLGPAP